MGTRQGWFQWVRMPLLVFLLVVAGKYMDSMMIGASRLDAGSAWTAWAVVALANVAFIMVVLLGRRGRQSAAFLAVEALVAAVVAFLPPFEWIRVFGFNTWTTAMVAGPAQPLATAWLGIVCLRLLRQLHDAPQPVSSEGPEQATARQPNQESR